MVAGDFAKEIVAQLRAGRMVIVDQSLGDPEMNRAAADRILWELFNAQKLDFVQPAKASDGTVLPPPDVLVYAEEAHNLLPKGSEADVQNIWSRAAKEGSKYRIGLVYATQEPSSIQSNMCVRLDSRSPRKRLSLEIDRRSRAKSIFFSFRLEFLFRGASTSSLRTMVN